MQLGIELNHRESGTAPSAVPIPRLFGYRASWVLKQVLQIIAVGGVALASYLFVSRFVLQSVEVVGVSMSPTLQNSDHYFLNRWIYHFRLPRRGDIVVIKDPADNGFSVKRVIATSGETVLVKNGIVLVDNVPLQEPYLTSAHSTYPDGARREQSLRCQEGEYVVMGDNRLNSADSRAYGPVPAKNILGLIIR